MVLEIPCRVDDLTPTKSNRYCVTPFNNFSGLTLRTNSMIINTTQKVQNNEHYITISDHFPELERLYIPSTPCYKRL